MRFLKSIFNIKNLKSLIVFLSGAIIILIAIGATIVSTGLSVAYFKTLTNDDVLSIVVLGFVVLLQSMVLIGSIVKGVIYNKTPQHYYTVVWFTRICFVVSVLSTISFFNGLSKVERTNVIQDLLYSIPFLNLNNNDWIVINLTNFTLIWASCFVIDLMSMYFPSIGSDLITGISTRKKLNFKDKSYVTKILELITYHPKKWIDKKCIEYGIIKSDSLQEHKNVMETLSSLQNSLQENIKCNENPLQNKNVMNDTLHDINKPITCNENSLHSKSNYRNELNVMKKCNEPNVMKKAQKPVNLDKTVCNERNDYSNKELNSLQNPLHSKSNKCNELNSLQKPITCNEPNVMNDKNVMKKCNEKLDSLQELITKIDTYVMENYKCNEKIKVGEIKKQFGLKPNDRKWNDKIRDSLKSCKVINGRLTRIENKKETFKLVK